MMMIEPPFVMTRSPPSPCYLPVLPLMETDRQTQLQPGPPAAHTFNFQMSTFTGQLSGVNLQMTNDSHVQPIYQGGLHLNK